MIQITRRIALNDDEIVTSFMRAQGPGGQNVNKVETAVELRFDVVNSPSLPDDVRARLIGLAGHRMTLNGVLIITSQIHRSQERNRDEAMNKLVDLIRQATIPPKIRRPTKPTKGSKERRLASKAKRSDTKSLRQRKPSFD